MPISMKDPGMMIKPPKQKYPDRGFQITPPKPKYPDRGMIRPGGIVSKAKEYAETLKKNAKDKDVQRSMKQAGEMVGISAVKAATPGAFKGAIAGASSGPISNTVKEFMLGTKKMVLDRGRYKESGKTGSWSEKKATK
jgi:hypothetical protein